MFSKYTTKGDINQLTPILIGFTMTFRPSVILEIGVRAGVSTVSFLEALDKIQKGKLISIDTKDCSGISENKRWAFHQQSSDVFELNEPIDMLFIDADHNYESVKKDFIKFEKKLLPGGVVMFHDTWPITEMHESPHYCNDAWKINHFLADRDDYMHITIPVSYGLTIAIKKPHDSKYWIKNSGLFHPVQPVKSITHE